MLFDLERATAPPPPAGSATGRHVFVAGLARAGTTALTRAIHGSGGVRLAHLPRHAVRGRAEPVGAAGRPLAAGDGPDRTGARRRGDGRLRQPGGAGGAVLARLLRRGLHPADALVPARGGPRDARALPGLRGPCPRPPRPRPLPRQEQQQPPAPGRAPAGVPAGRRPGAVPRARGPGALAAAAACALRHQRRPVRARLHDLAGPSRVRPGPSALRHRRRPAGRDRRRASTTGCVLWLSVHHHLLARAEAGGAAMVPVAYEDLCAGDGLAWRAAVPPHRHRAPGPAPSPPRAGAGAGRRARSCAAMPRRSTARCWRCRWDRRLGLPPVDLQRERAVA